MTLRFPWDASIADGISAAERKAADDKLNRILEKKFEEQRKKELETTGYYLAPPNWPVHDPEPIFTKPKIKPQGYQDIAFGIPTPRVPSALEFFIKRQQALREEALKQAKDDDDIEAILLSLL